VEQPWLMPVILKCFAVVLARRRFREVLLVAKVQTLLNRSGGSNRSVNGSSDWIVYILKCADQTLYTGITSDIDRRIIEHENGTGAKYTRGRAPFTLLYTETHASRSQALKREAEIKSLDRAMKLQLMSSGNSE
jgi:putative endonuclease